MASWLHATPTGTWLLVLLLALAGLAITAYALRALDLMGAVASFLLGLLIVLLGGLGWLLLMVAFTVLGFMATRVGKKRKEEQGTAEDREGERGAKNVLANGAAAGLAALAVLVVPQPAAAVAFVTAIAAVTADTLASEIGTLAPRARRVLPPFEVLASGRNGGVSWRGQAAASIGALAIAVLAVGLGMLSAGWAAVATVGGFLGCQVDSVLGATLERDELHDRPLSKQDVNFLASALPALVVLVIARLA